jgi:competence protein ComEC
MIIGSCKESLRTTLAAQVFTLPIILYHFHELSTVVLVSNVALLWLMPYIVTASVMLFIAASLNIHILAVVFGALTTFLTHIFLKLVQLFGGSAHSLLPLTEPQAHRIVFVYFISTLILLVAQKWSKMTMHERNEQ